MFDELKNSVSDFIDGLFGIKQKSTIDDVELEVITEKSRSLSVSVTNRRVEKGFNISDTARKEPLIFSLTVMDNSKKREMNRKSLEEIMNLAEPVQFFYAGRDLYENMVVESIEEVIDSQYKNCYVYHISLRQIDMAEIKAEDSKTSYKDAKSTGGSKQRNTATVKSPTNKEVGAVQKESRGKSAAKNIF